MVSINRQIHLVSRPHGEPTAENFKLVEAKLPPLNDGQVLVRHHFLSLDPYMRGRMDDSKSYAAPQPLGEVMLGATAGQVIESRHPDFRPGDDVVGAGGWQQYALVDPSVHGALRKVDASRVPLSAHLGVLGMPGVTAWYGLVKVCAAKPGETVVVSSASGAVGSVVGQLAKLRGCSAVGIAGGPDKCRYVVEELGFDACLDHKLHKDFRSLNVALKDACPNGIDCDFENVGGMVLDAVMMRMNAFGRIALCGTIAGYNRDPIPIAFPQLILRSRLMLQGFLVGEHLDMWPQALTELAALVAEGKLKYRESVAHGIEAAPEAFLGLLMGKNFGKQLVKLI